MRNTPIRTLVSITVLVGLAACSSKDATTSDPDLDRGRVTDSGEDVPTVDPDSVGDPDSVAPDTVQDLAEDSPTDDSDSTSPDIDLDTGDDVDDGPCACAARNRCEEDVLPRDGLVLEVVEETDFWVAYESPSPFASSLAWGDGHLWVSDLLRGYIAEFEETDEGLRLVRVVEPPRDPYGQARDMTHDGEALWTIDWGSVIRHDPSDFSAEIWVTEGEIGSPNLHHMRAVAWDGTRLWSALSGQLYEHSTDDHSVETTHQVDQWGATVGMAFHDGDLWVSNRAGGFVDRYNPDSLELINRYSIVAQPYGIAWSETNLWLYDWVTKRIYKMKDLPTTPLDTQNRYLTSETFTVPNNLEGDATWTLEDSPYKLEDGFAIPAGTTLTIEAGVEVYTQGVIGVEGTLLAEGEPDAPILFTHIDPLQMWGGFDFVQGSHDSVLRYVDVLYATDGLKFQDVVIQPIVGCTFRKSGVDGLYFQLRAAGDYNPIELRGNHFDQGGGAAAKAILDAGVNLPSITFVENSAGYYYASAFIIETESGSLPDPTPAALYEHNILEHGFRGVGAGFPALRNTVFRNNHLYGSVSGSGVQPFNDGNELTHNLLEYTSEQAYQLHPSHLVTDTVFSWNTVRAGGFDTDWGDDTIVVSHNNLLALPWAGNWIDAESSDTQIRNNWWGTSDLGAIRDRIFDGYWLENDGQETDRGYVETDPILEAPNGIGFVQGTVMASGSQLPIRGAEVVVGENTTHTAADGRFFSSAPEGEVSVVINAEGYTELTVESSVCSGELTIASGTLTSE